MASNPYEFFEPPQTIPSIFTIFAYLIRMIISPFVFLAFWAWPSETQRHDFDPRDNSVCC